MLQCARMSAIVWYERNICPLHLPCALFCEPFRRQIGCAPLLAPPPYLHEGRRTPPVSVLSRLRSLFYILHMLTCAIRMTSSHSLGTPLAFRMCCRHQAWRFISYSFLHASLSHIGFNCVIQLIIGIPLEMKNGSSRMYVSNNQITSYFLQKTS